jgi:hypothetical protein
MSDRFRLPVLVRAGFMWNKYGVRGRGHLVRLIGRRFVREGDYVVQTRHGAKLIVDLPNLDIYATIFNSGGEWDSPILAKLVKDCSERVTYSSTLAPTRVKEVNRS